MEENNVTKSQNRVISSVMTLKDWGFSSDTCQFCGIHTNEIDNLLMQCGKCKKAYYCSMKCFNTDLVEHQKICGTAKLKSQPEGLDSKSSHSLKFKSEKVVKETKVKKSSQKVPDQKAEIKAEQKAEIKADQKLEIKVDQKVENKDEKDSDRDSKKKKTKKIKKEKKTKKDGCDDSTGGKKKKVKKKKEKENTSKTNDTFIPRIIQTDAFPIVDIDSSSDASESDTLDHSIHYATADRSIPMPEIKPFITQELLPCEESFDENSIFSELTGRTIVCDCNSDDSSNVSEVSFEERALLGEDEDSDGDEDESFLLEDSNTDFDRHSKCSSINDSTAKSTRFWTGTRYTRVNPDKLKDKKNLKESGVGSGDPWVGKTIKQNSRRQLLTLNTGSSHSRSRRTSSRIKEFDTGSLAMADTKESNIPETSFLELKLTHVDTVEKKEFTWLVPEWVNGVLLRRKRLLNGPLAGKILNAGEVTPNDPDYYEEGSRPSKLLEDFDSICDNSIPSTSGTRRKASRTNSFPLKQSMFTDLDRQPPTRTRSALSPRQKSKRNLMMNDIVGVYARGDLTTNATKRTTEL